MPLLSVVVPQTTKSAKPGTAGTVRPLVAATDQGGRERKGTAMPLVSCSACGEQISDAAPACPQCGQPTGRTGRGDSRRRGLPVWGKILLFLLLGVVVVSFFAVGKPSEAKLRQAIRDK